QQIVDRCSVISAEGWDRREHGFTDEEAVTGRYVPHVVPLHSIETDVHLVAWIHRKEAVIVDTGLKGELVARPGRLKLRPNTRMQDIGDEEATHIVEVAQPRVAGC